MKTKDPMRWVLDLVYGLFDSPAEGEIKIPSSRDGRFGTIVVVEEIVICEPTREKIEAELRKIWTSGFQGNVILPRRLEDPFVIRKEDYREPAYRLLTEHRGLNGVR
jgi:hypothetical protein